MSDMHRWDATETLSAIGHRLVTAEETVTAAVSRIDLLNPVVNAVIHRTDPEGAGRPGPLHGVPFLLKDLGASSMGESYHMGNALLRERDYKSSVESALSRRFRDSGLAVVGRTNTPEFGLTATTEPVAYGATRNPWALEHTAGGSSGGAGAAVAACMVPAAHGNDGGGSMRIPAACNGVVGFKSSRGRVSNGPEMGEAWAGLAHEGVLTRSIRDAALFLDVISGYEVGDPYTAPPPARTFTRSLAEPCPRLRIAVLDHGCGYAVDPEIVSAVRAVAGVLSDLGHDVHTATPEPFQDLQSVGDYLYRLFGSYAGFDMAYLGNLIGREATADDVEPLTAYHAERGLSMSIVDHLNTIAWIHDFGRRLSGFFSDVDILLLPTVAERAPMLGDIPFNPSDPQRSLDRMMDFMPFTVPFNMSGQPAISLPLGQFEDGLPLGVQVVGRFAEDDVVLGLSAELERALPWAGRMPQVVAGLLAGVGDS